MRGCGYDKISLTRSLSVCLIIFLCVYSSNPPSIKVTIFCDTFQSCDNGLIDGSPRSCSAWSSLVRCAFVYQRKFEELTFCPDFEANNFTPASKYKFLFPRWNWVEGWSILQIAPKSHNVLSVGISLATFQGSSIWVLLGNGFGSWVRFRSLRRNSSLMTYLKLNFRALHTRNVTSTSDTKGEGYYSTKSTSSHFTGG